VGQKPLGGVPEVSEHGKQNEYGVEACASASGTVLSSEKVLNRRSENGLLNAAS